MSESSVQPFMRSVCSLGGQRPDSEMLQTFVLERSRAQQRRILEVVRWRVVSYVSTSAQTDALHPAVVGKEANTIWCREGKIDMCEFGEMREGRGVSQRRAAADIHFLEGAAQAQTDQRLTARSRRLQLSELRTALKTSERAQPEAPVQVHPLERRAL